MARRISPALKAIQQQARTERLAQRARLIDAGVVPSKGKNKYNRVKVQYKGEMYDSLGEAEHAASLDLDLSLGRITAWGRPGPIILLDAPTPRGRITYRPDFWTLPLNASKVYYTEFKGSRVNPKTGKRSTPTETEAFRIRVKLWQRFIPYELRVVYSDGASKVVSPAKT